MTSFTKLNLEKQEKIINVCLRLFALNGYKNTSTNLIISEAQISKGSLFYYFKNKKNLYLFLYDYGINFILNEIKKENCEENSDFFDMIITIQRIKCDLMKKYPYIFEFLLSTYTEEDKSIKDEINRKNNDETKKIWNNFLLNIDKSKFKDIEDVSKLVKLIIWSGNGFMKETLSSSKIDIDKMQDEFTDIIKVLKKNFYKEEYL